MVLTQLGFCVRRVNITQKNLGLSCYIPHVKSQHLPKVKYLDVLYCILLCSSLQLYHVLPRKVKASYKRQNTSPGVPSYSQSSALSKQQLSICEVQCLPKFKILETSHCAIVSNQSFAHIYHHLSECLPKAKYLICPKCIIIPLKSSALSHLTIHEVIKCTLQGKATLLELYFPNTHL